MEIIGKKQTIIFSMEEDEIDGICTALGDVLELGLKDSKCSECGDEPLELDVMRLWEFVKELGEVLNEKEDKNNKK